MSQVFRTMVAAVCLLGFCCPAGPAFGVGEGHRTQASQKFRSIPETRLQEGFKSFLCRRLRKSAEDVVVSKFKVAGNTSVPVGEQSFQLFHEHKGELEGLVRLTAVVRVDGQVESRIKLSGWVDVFDRVVCASRNIQRGEELRDGDVHLARKNIARQSSKYLTDMNQVVGHTVKHNVKANACIKTWMLVRTPTVEKGSLVTILAESGSLRVTAPGKVLSRGFTGEMIKVQNLMSSKEIYAEVVDTSTVKVEF